MPLALLVPILWSTVATPRSDAQYDQLWSMRDRGLLLPCDDAPAPAVLKLPPPFERIARVVCTKYGHIITAAEGTAWFWSYSQGTPAMILAADDESAFEEMPSHGLHFTQIQFEQVSPAERLLRLDDLYGRERVAHDKSQMRVHKVGLTTSRGSRKWIFLFAYAGERAPLPHLYLMECRQDCTPDHDSADGRVIVFLPRSYIESVGRPREASPPFDHRP